MSAAAPLFHREYVVDEGCARRMSRAAARYRATRPLSLTVLALEFLVAVLTLISGPRWIGAIFAVVFVLLAATTFAQVPQLERRLLAEGYRPGAVVVTDWGRDTFVIATPLAHKAHYLRDVFGLRLSGDIATVRMRSSRVLLVLPESLVPPEVRPALSGRSARR